MTLLTKIKNDLLPSWAMVILAFCIPLHQRMAPVAAGILVLTWLISGNWTLKWEHLRRAPYFVFPCLYYLVHVIAMVYTENKEAGWKDLETKASLFVLPLVIGSAGLIDLRLFRRIMHAFLWGLILAVFYGLLQASWNYFYEWYQVQRGLLNGQYYNVEFFFAAKLSPFVHPGYFSLFVSAGTLLLLHSVLQAPQPQIRKKWAVMLAALFTVVTFLLAARIGIIVQGVIWLWFFIHWIRMAKNKLVPFIILAGGLGITTIIFLSSDNLKHRISQTLESLTSANPESDSRSRIHAVGLSKALSNLPWGVGTGDVKNELVIGYNERGWTDLSEKRLNAHNQYIQSLLAAGILALLLLLVTFVVPIWRNRHPFSFFLICSWAFFMYFESVLEIQAGVMFLAFFLPLLFAFRPATEGTVLLFEGFRNVGWRESMRNLFLFRDK